LKKETLRIDPAKLVLILVIKTALGVFMQIIIIGINRQKVDKEITAKKDMLPVNFFPFERTAISRIIFFIDHDRLVTLLDSYSLHTKASAMGKVPNISLLMGMPLNWIP
jgi:hypothetical protein